MLKRFSRVRVDFCILARIALYKLESLFTDASKLVGQALPDSIINSLFHSDSTSFVCQNLQLLKCYQYRTKKFEDCFLQPTI